MTASLTSGTGANVGNYTYTYNSDGKLAGSLYTGTYSDTVSYTYNGNIIYRSVAAGVNSSVDTITLNNAGFMVLDKEVVGTNNFFMNYTYDANEQLQTFTEQENAYPLITAAYTFTNGDNTLISQTSLLDTLVYDTSRLAVNGNLDQFSQLLYLGAVSVKNKHLILADHHGYSTIYSYVFTTDGNISSMTMTTGNNSETITYSYDCN